MKARVNTHALSATRFDSASLGVLGTLAHPLEKSGRHLATVHRGAAVVARFEVLVDDDSTATQADVDLARLTGACGAGRPNPDPLPAQTVRPGGYLVLHASEGAGGFWVTLDHAATGAKERKPQRVFDSRKLDVGDLFVVTLIRPGDYVVTDGSAGAKAAVKVTYPEPDKAPFRPPGPATVKLGNGKMAPDKLVLASAQGLIFFVEAAGAAISVVLRSPEDRPENALPKGVQRRVRWNRPGGVRQAPGPNGSDRKRPRKAD